MFCVTSPIDINLPTRSLLAVETNSSNYSLRAKKGKTLALLFGDKSQFPRSFKASRRNCPFLRCATHATLQTCRLADCRLADCRLADCGLGFGIKNCRLNYSSFNSTRPSMVIFPTAKCAFGGRQSSVIELVTPSQYCLKLLD